jgi:hypothetical protein
LKKTFKVFCATLSAVLISGCSGTTIELTPSPSPTGPELQSFFATPAADGFIVNNLKTTVSDYQSIPDGYAVLLGLTNNDFVVAYSGLNPNVEAGIVQNTTGGSVNYTTFAQADSLEALADGTVGHVLYGGTVNLTANFDDGTLTSTNTILDGDGVVFTSGEEYDTTAVLRVNGMIDGQDVSGSVIFVPTGQSTSTGDLIGLAGDNYVVGAFHGAKFDDFIYAGGFVGDAD